MFVFKYKFKPSIIFHQLEDYYDPQPTIFFDMNDNMQYRKACLFLQGIVAPRKRGRPKKLHKSKEGNLYQIIAIQPKHITDLKYLLRFPSLTISPTDFGREYLSSDDQIIYWNYKNFQGYFEDIIFPHNNLYDWDELEASLRSNPKNHGVPCLYDVFIMELFRIQLGIQNYSQFTRILRMLGMKKMAHLLKCPQWIPSVDEFSKFYHLVPVEVFEKIFHQLSEQIMKKFNLPYRILIWDGQFFHTNSSDYKNLRTNSYSDSDTYVARHNNKFLGVGYYASTLYVYCKDVLVPIESIILPGNTSDKKQFPAAYSSYEARHLPNPVIILSDGGPYSKQLVQDFAVKGIMLLINVPKTVKNESIITTPNDKRFLEWSVPFGWSLTDLQKLYNVRSSIEQMFSHNNIVYHADEMLIRSLDQAKKHRYMVLILDLLKISSSLGLGRGDLALCSTAFSELRGFKYPEKLHPLLDSDDLFLLKRR